MPPLKFCLAVTALGLSLHASSSVAALRLPIAPAPGARVRNPIASSVALHPHERAARRGKNDAGRHTTCLASHGRGREDRDGSRSDRKEQNESDDGDDENEGLINLNDFVDFEKMDKMFDDVPEYGVIRSLESPYNNPIEAVSAEEMEMWTKKKNLQNNERRKRRLWRTLFPWASPLASLLLPGRHAPPGETGSGRSGSKSKRRHSYFSGGASSPKLLRRFASAPNSARNMLAALNVVAFVYQIATALRYLPGFNRVLATSVAGDAYSATALGGGIPQWTPLEVVLRALGLAGGGAGVVITSGSRVRGQMGRVIGRGPIAAHSMGPFFLDYSHQPYPLSHFQKHRYLSSGFLHGSLLHIGMNMRALLTLPSWLENGIGKGVYLSAYLVSIVTGNIAHTLSSLSGRAASNLCIGASGGVCGLYGLMLASLLKMGNVNAAYYVLKQMVWLIAFGILVPNVSNASHLGGFVGGWLIGYLFGPGYERSYSLNRTGGSSRDSADWEFRQMMGPGIYPSSEKSILPLKWLWAGIGLSILTRPDLRLIPMALLKGILEPGTLSGARTLLIS